MPSERPYIPNYDFEPGELMPWQEMSKRLRELAETCSELASILGAEYSDIKTRLDDLEERMGNLQDISPDDVFVPVESGNSGFEDAEMRRLERIPWGTELEQAGTHPSNCRCAWCEPGDGTAWGS